MGESTKQIKRKEKATHCRDQSLRPLSIVSSIGRDGAHLLNRGGKSAMSKMTCSHHKTSHALQLDIQHCLVTFTNSTDLGMAQSFLSWDPSHISIGLASVGQYVLIMVAT